MEPPASPASGAQAPSRMSDRTVSSLKVGALFLHVSLSLQPPALSLGAGWGGVGSSSEEETATLMPWEAAHLTISLGEAGTEWGRHAGCTHLSVNIQATQGGAQGLTQTGMWSLNQVEATTSYVSQSLSPFAFEGPILQRSRNAGNTQLPASVRHAAITFDGPCVCAFGLVFLTQPEFSGRVSHTEFSTFL